ncbi:MAG TPA: hypothetical protein P5572_06860 [Phycisphaerae bacterium]|nr:hypothetical protein [Phycisphaerales bacterium]HRX84726.1 hypothetical protein [Phycisphaerae bacterium]
MRARRIPITLLAGGLLTLATSCSRDDAGKAGSGSSASASPPPVRRDPLEGGPFPAIVLSEAQFSFTQDANGKRRPVPGNAKLVILRKTDAGWREVVLEDDAANVMHKAIPLAGPNGAPSLITISGTAALLKLWRWQDDRWNVATLWHPTFGGTWDRLRDIEIDDVTGDDEPEMVIATHDQGVVAVLGQTDDNWTITEVDRAPDTFVHEIEIGDVDGDGRNEFFATPSKPNNATLASQPGSVVMYRWDGTRFARSVVAAFPRTHAKEILVADLEGLGHAVLWAAVEAETEMRGQTLTTVHPVEIREYRYAGGAWRDRTIATLPDTQCRVLTAGDLDHDGVTDVVATGMRSGVWWLRRAADDTWTLTSIDRNSSGFEHAATIGDLLDDGQDALYVAADEQHELRCYRWNGTDFDRTVIAALPASEITFNIALGRF